MESGSHSAFASRRESLFVLEVESESELDLRLESMLLWARGEGKFDLQQFDQRARRRL